MLSLIHGHKSIPGHPSMLDNFGIVSKKGQGFTRSIKKSIFITSQNSKSRTSKNFNIKKNTEHNYSLLEGDIKADTNISLRFEDIFQ